VLRLGGKHESEGQTNYTTGGDKKTAGEGGRFIKNAEKTSIRGLWGEHCNLCRSARSAKKRAFREEMSGRGCQHGGRNSTLSEGSKGRGKTEGNGGSRKEQIPKNRERPHHRRQGKESLRMRVSRLKRIGEKNFTWGFAEG